MNHNGTSTRPWVAAAAALTLAATLAGCGGAGGGSGDDGSSPSVANLTANPTRYGQTMVVTISGRNLLQGVDVGIEGGRCDNLTQSAGASNDTVQFNCVVRSLGEMTARVRTTTGGRELGSVRFSIPVPQVRVTLTEGTGSTARAGSFVIELDPAAAPATVDNFLAYATAGGPFYVNTLVSFAEPTQGIVLGGFQQNAQGVLSTKTPTREPIALEASAERRNLRGTVAMFRRSNDAQATTEWVVNTQDNPFLDVGSVAYPGGLAVFGRITEGIEIAEEAAKVPVRFDLVNELSRVPVTAIRISAITQIR